MDIKGEMKFLLDKWHGNKPKEGDSNYDEYLKDKDRYFYLKSQLQIEQAEAIFGVKAQPLSLSEQEILKEVGDAVIAWKINKDEKVEVLIKRK